MAQKRYLLLATLYATLAATLGLLVLLGEASSPLLSLLVMLLFVSLGGYALFSMKKGT